MILEKKFKNLAHQSAYAQPFGAKPLADGVVLGWGPSVVSVSSVAREWNITARRVRVMLSEGRLNGRQLENGYWEVFFPYSYVFGKRGPVLKRQQKGLEELAAKPKRLQGEDAEAFREFSRDK
jgi:hypothetical protein